MAAIGLKWEVKCLIGHRVKNDKLELLVLYKGYSISSAEWQHVAEVRKGAKESVEEYFSRLNVRDGRELFTKINRQKKRPSAAKRQQRKRRSTLKKATTQQVTAVPVTPPPMAPAMAGTLVPVTSAAPPAHVLLPGQPVSSSAPSSAPSGVPTTVIYSTVASTSASSPSLPAPAVATGYQLANTTASTSSAAETGVLSIPSSPTLTPASPAPLHPGSVAAGPSPVGLSRQSGTGHLGFDSLIAVMPRTVEDKEGMKAYQLYVTRTQNIALKKKVVHLEATVERMEKEAEMKLADQQVEAAQNNALNKEVADLKAIIRRMEREAEKKHNDQQGQDSDEEMEE